MIKKVKKTILDCKKRKSLFEMLIKFEDENLSLKVSSDLLPSFVHQFFKLDNAVLKILHSKELLIIFVQWFILPLVDLLKDIWIMPPL